MKYNQVYGRFSLGTGNWIKKSLFEKGKEDVYAPSVIDSYVKQVSLDLSRIKIEKELKNLSVMDVGTGRQSLAFYKLGAKKVTHYDISATNVKNFSQYTKLNNIPIKSFNVDICDSDFNGTNKFDFIYLQGIIQHVKNPYSAIKNLSDASKKGAKLWFYNYQAGPIQHLYAEALRKIIPRRIKYQNLTLKLKRSNFSLKNIDMIIDDLGCSYRNLIKNNSYKKTLNQFGFSRYFIKDVENQNKGLDLRTKTLACISAYKKENIVLNSVQADLNELIHVNHFDPNNFIPSQREFLKQVKVALDLIISKIKKHSLSHDQLFDICMPLFKGLALHDLNKPFDENKRKLLTDFRYTSKLIESLFKN